MFHEATSPTSPLPRMAKVNLPRLDFLFNSFPLSVLYSFLALGLAAILDFSSCFK